MAQSVFCRAGAAVTTNERILNIPLVASAGCAEIAYPCAGSPVKLTTLRIVIRDGPFPLAACAWQESLPIPAEGRELCS
jgi:hypothetical protein